MERKADPREKGRARARGALRASILDPPSNNSRTHPRDSRGSNLLSIPSIASLAWVLGMCQILENREEKEARMAGRTSLCGSHPNPTRHPIFSRKDSSLLSRTKQVHLQQCSTIREWKCLFHGSVLNPAATTPTSATGSFAATARCLGTLPGNPQR